MTSNSASRGSVATSVPANAVPTNTQANAVHMRQNGRCRQGGITLLPVILAFLSITAVLSVLQARELAQTRVMGRIVDLQREAMDERALHALITVNVGRAMINPDGGAAEVRGTSFPLTFDGRQWDVALQDVEGLIDIFLAPPNLLERARLPTARILEGRAALADQSQFGRLATLAQTMAFMGIPEEEVGRVTQSAREPGLRLEVVPDTLRSVARGLPDALLVSGQTKTVRVAVERRKTDRTK